MFDAFFAIFGQALNGLFVEVLNGLVAFITSLFAGFLPTA